MNPIRLNDEYTLDPLELVQSRLLIQGNSGCAKSSLLRLIVEQIAGAVPTIIIDPEGEFYTVREVVPMVLVGEGGEIPCDVASAGRVARGLLESGVSAIIDLSSLHSTEQSPYVARFAGALMEAPRSLWRDMFIGIDEAHRFCPQSGKGNESGPQVIDLMKRGRKRGIGTGLVTQRVSSLDKDAAGEAATVFVGRTTLSNDIDRARATLGLRRADAEVVRSFKRGEWFAHGPAIESDGVARMRVDRPQTKEPKRGSASVPPVAHSDAIAAIAAEVAELAADDRPTTLAEAQEAIDTLTAELATARRETVRALKRAEQAAASVVDHAAVREAAELAASEVRGVALDALEELGRLHASGLETASRAIRERADTVSRTFGNTSPSGRAVKASADSALARSRPSAAPVSVASTSPAPKAPRDRVIRALAWYQSVGINEPTPTQVGLLAGYKAGAGHFGSILSRMKSDGDIDRGGGTVRLLIDPGPLAPADPLSLEDLHASILGVSAMGEPHRKVLGYIIDQGPGVRTPTDDLAHACGYTPGTGHFGNVLSRLRTMGLIDRGRGEVWPTDAVFPPNLIHSEYC